MWKFPSGSCACNRLLIKNVWSKRKGVITEGIRVLGGSSGMEIVLLEGVNDLQVHIMALKLNTFGGG